MHELSVTKALTDMIVRSATENRAEKVNFVDVVMGKQCGYEPECIEMYFEILSEGTLAEKAVLRFKSTEGREFYIDQMEIEGPDGD